MPSSAARVLLDGDDIYGAADAGDRGAQAHRHGLPEAQPLPGHDHRAQRAGRAALCRHEGARRTSARTSCEEMLTKAGLWNEVRNRLERPWGRALRRAAAAPLHRPGPGGATERAADGRALLGPRPHLDEAHRGDHPGDRRRRHRRHRHPQHAAGPAGVAIPVPSSWRPRTSPATSSSPARPSRSSRTRATRGRRTMSTDASAEAWVGRLGPCGCSRRLGPSVLRLRGRRRGQALRAALVVVAMLGIVAPIGALAAVATSSLSAVPALANGPLVNGGGSSYAAVAIDQWRAEILSIDGDNINYNTTSSVIGLNEFAQNQLDFGASEIGYSTGQASATPERALSVPAGRGRRHVPHVQPHEHHRAPDHPDTAQRRTSWRRSSPGRSNTGTTRKSRRSTVASCFHTPPSPSSGGRDASGDNYLFSEYLAFEHGSLWNAFAKAMQYPAGADAVFPYPQQGGYPKQYNLTGWIGAQGSDIASNDVAAQNGAITYVETAYAYEHAKPCAYVENASGHYVIPTEENDAVGARGRASSCPTSSRSSTASTRTRSRAPTRSPPTATSSPRRARRHLRKAPSSGSSSSSSPARGQDAAGQLGYSPLPPNLVEDDFQRHRPHRRRRQGTGDADGGELSQSLCRRRDATTGGTGPGRDRRHDDHHNDDATDRQQRRVEAPQGQRKGQGGHAQADHRQRQLRRLWRLDGSALRSLDVALVRCRSRLQAAASSNELARRAIGRDALGRALGVARRARPAGRHTRAAAKSQAAVERGEGAP